MPADGAREELRFLEEFLLVVFAEVQVRGRGGVQGEDVGRGFEFGDGYEADLWLAGGVGCLYSFCDVGQVFYQLFRSLGIDLHAFVVGLWHFCVDLMTM